MPCFEHNLFRGSLSAQKPSHARPFQHTDEEYPMTYPLTHHRHKEPLCPLRSATTASQGIAVGKLLYYKRLQVY